MKNMKRSQRRSKNQKVVDYRKKIIKYIFKSISQRMYLQEGRLRKYNFTCSCYHCNSDKIDKVVKPKYRWYYENRDMD